ncbi:MAG: hypothetical protein HYV08_05180 [Deltaproteobacteria bacterium]|nr:hypothetical protein [Deltaproteobacteria bacterium]MBI3076920.1 hypothetical protein [Deltaproteobacteria bacterium]
MMEAVAELQAQRIEVEASPEEVYAFALERGWTDGLPVMPPTEEQVRAMVAAAGRPPGAVVGAIPPRWAPATVEKVAINAVMAGCLPAYMPVILAAIEAMVDPVFNLYGVQATTNPVAPLVLVNGPVAHRLEINAGYNALGQGWRANATIGRALRLVLLNVGGGTPGEMDRATHGQPGKYTFCFAENEAESPWEPLHVERGFPRETSVVTVVGAAGTQNMIDQGSLSGEGLLRTFISTMAVVGTNNVYFGGDPMLVISPEHARTLAADGFTKAAIRQALFERARVPLAAFSRDNVEHVLRKRRPHLFARGEPESVPIADQPGDFLIVVAGGAGKHSTFIATFGVNRSVTRPVREAA